MTPLSIIIFIYLKDIRNVLIMRASNDLLTVPMFLYVEKICTNCYVWCANCTKWYVCM